MACTQQYGGPETATVKGTLDGKEIDAKFSRVNGCEIARWEAAKDAVRGSWVSHWRVTVRTGPKVEKERHDALEAALDAVEMHARATANTERRATVDMRVRRYEAGDQVAARVGAERARRRRGRRRARRRRRAGVDRPLAPPAAPARGRRDGLRGAATPFRPRASSRSAAASASGRASPGTRDSSSRQKRGEWSMTSRWQTSCSIT